MKFAIVSDTHGNAANFKKVVSWLNKEDIKLILHAGDIGSPESLKESLEEFNGEFFGVFGNMDKDYKILIDEHNRTPRVKIEQEVMKIAIGKNTKLLTNSSELVNGKKVIAVTHFPAEAKKLAQSGNFDLVFYGHTHMAWEEKIGAPAGGSCRMINPGELAGQFYKPTFAVYDTETDKLELK